ncbi:ZP domain-containing protein-like isoform X1 [Branchiostoma floridae]|uniref:ZP domain-containing protein-like isoform X1 n=1 Tax=Branchiostoma floridae TaxID=7739 RepID=A0A9J7MWH2_BRAFL|nr:ZP domain-containing protein-like isoform X1 [Branchiostoma floridae]
MGLLYLFGIMVLGAGVNGQGGLSNLVVLDVDLDYIKIGWTVSPGFNVSSYRVRYTPWRDGSYRDLSPAPGANDNTTTITGLHANETYTITVTSFGADGEITSQVSIEEVTNYWEVWVSCDQTHMEISLPLKGLSGVNAAGLHLLNSSCLATVDANYATLRTGLQECGTIQENYGNDKFRFRNSALAKPELDENGAQRYQPFARPFYCEFVRLYVKSLEQNVLYTIPDSSLQFEIEHGNNTFIFDMHLYTSSDFIHKYDTEDYPIQFLPTDDMHVGLAVQTTLTNLELFVQDCFATPTSDKNDLTRLNVIDNGCDKDTTLVTQSDGSDPLVHQFSVQAFTFPNSTDNVLYLHCTMVVCMADDAGSRCAQGCVEERRRRDVSDHDRAVRLEKKGGEFQDRVVSISQGPIVLLRASPSEQAETDTPPIQLTVGVVLGAAAVVLIALLVFALWYRRGKTGTLKTNVRITGNNDHAHQMERNWKCHVQTATVEI